MEAYIYNMEKTHLLILEWIFLCLLCNKVNYICNNED